MNFLRSPYFLGNPRGPPFAVSPCPISGAGGTQHFFFPRSPPRGGGGKRRFPQWGGNDWGGDSSSRCHPPPPPPPPPPPSPGGAGAGATAATLSFVVASTAAVRLAFLNPAFLHGVQFPSHLQLGSARLSPLGLLWSVLLAAHARAPAGSGLGGCPGPFSTNKPLPRCACVIPPLPHWGGG